MPPLRPFLFAVVVSALPAQAPAAVQAPPSAPPPDPTSPGPRTVEREAWLMGTRVGLTVEAADPGVARAAAEAALRSLESTEDLLSTWDPASELGRLNAAPPGETRATPPALAPILATAWEWRETTKGAFEPALGPLVDAWDLRAEGRRPSPREVAAALEATGPRGIRLTAEGTRWTRLHPGAWVDAGGFGKGAGLAAAARTLREAGPVARARVDLGGQLLLHAPADAPWEVAVAHPLRRREPAVRLRLHGAPVSVATSGASERGIVIDGETLGHLLDPRTGQPVPAWGSVTVVHPDPLAADVLSTALFVLGPWQGPEWLRSHPEIAALFLEIRDGQAISWHTVAMDRWISSERTRDSF